MLVVPRAMLLGRYNVLKKCAKSRAKPGNNTGILGDIVGLVPDHHDKMNIIKQVTNILVS